MPEQTELPQQSVMVNRPRRRVFVIVAILILVYVALNVWVYVYGTRIFGVKFGNVAKRMTIVNTQPTLPSPTQPKEVSTITPVPVEGNIGTIVDLVTKPDGNVQLTVDGGKTIGQKTYQVPKDLQVKLYTSSTQTTSVPITQLTKGMIVNVIKFTNPEHYVVVGVTDKGLVEKLL